MVGLRSLNPLTAEKDAATRRQFLTDLRAGLKDEGTIEALGMGSREATAFRR
jgi:hypothetical protein